ncbi:MAG: ATP-binding cassette domain-containing protein [Chitinophagales bacterium]|nr:ATP-binding cassette domain-containing protein [Bacteroidota bacterium]MBX7141579.1 ATP-binding cassette domain-containing protein [Chitinophagales bacterium]
MIEIRDVRKSFGETDVLRGISGTFLPGKTSLVIGTSGSGKTVLMKCMVGLLQPTSGHILYNGDTDFVALDEKEKKEIRKQIGMLFQGAALFDSMTVEQNVMFPLNMFTDMSLKERLHRVDECLDRVNLKGSNKLMPSELSGGMKKRVGIARAIVMNPKFLFCDEPNSGLDPQTSILIDELVHEITEEFNITTIVNTHDMNSVIGIGDYILFLHKGEKAWEGDKHSVLKSDSQALNDFIFASKYLREIKEQLNR